MTRRRAYSAVSIAVLMILFGTQATLFAQTGDNSPSPPASEEAAIVPDPDEYGLDQVEDVTRLLPEDSSAYYGLLHRAATVPQSQLRKAGLEFVQQRRKKSGEETFADMLYHPEAFRGQPVTLEGHLLQAVEYKAQPNDYGIERLYEAALFTDDSAHHPTTVVFLEKPPELKLGTEISERVRVAGYFLKMYIYPSNDNKIRKAPLILAKTITVFPRPKPKPIVPAPVAFGLFATIIVVVVIAVWIGFHKDQKRLKARRQQELERNRPDFDKLD